MLNHKTIYERESLSLSDDNSTIPDSITKSDAKRLKIAVENSYPNQNTDKYLSFTSDQITAKKYVGIVGTNNCVIEILPKIKFTDDKRESKVISRKRLMQMLAVVHDINVDYGALTKINWEENTILESFIELFSEKLMNLNKKGLPKSYVAREEDLPKLRGSLNIIQQFTKNAVYPSRLSCRFDEFTTNNTINQLIKATIKHIYQLTSVQKNKQQLRKLSFFYSDIDNVQISKLLSKKIVLNRTHKEWKDILEMAVFLLKNSFQTPVIGKQDGFSFLFNIEYLFEKYVGNRLKEIVLNEYIVKTRIPGEFCILNPDKNKFQTELDIMIENFEKGNHIIDTKWKSLTNDGDRGVEHPDIYQMISYGEIYNAKNLTLVYPHNSDLPEEGVQFCGIINNNFTKALMEFDNKKAQLTEIEKEQVKYLTVFTIDLANLDLNHENDQLKILYMLNNKY